MDKIEEIAGKLSEAQREGLLRAPCRSWWGDVPACMPHLKRTAEALRQRGLCIQSLRSDAAFPLTDLGIQLKAYLERNGRNV